MLASTLDLLTDRSSSNPQISDSVFIVSFSRNKFCHFILQLMEAEYILHIIPLYQIVYYYLCNSTNVYQIGTNWLIEIIWRNIFSFISIVDYFKCFDQLFSSEHVRMGILLQIIKTTIL